MKRRFGQATTATALPLGSLLLLVLLLVAPAARAFRPGGPPTPMRRTPVGGTVDVMHACRWVGLDGTQAL